MRARSIFCSATLATTILLSPVCAMAQANLSGVWTFNMAASDLGDIPPPRSDVMTIRHRGNKFAWSEVIVMPNGSMETESWEGFTDGVARPVTGAPGSKASYKPDGSGRWTSPDGDSELQATLSDNGRRLVLTSTTTRPDHRASTQKFVYDRRESATRRPAQKRQD